MVPSSVDRTGWTSVLNGSILVLCGVDYGQIHSGLDSIVPSSLQRGIRDQPLESNLPGALKTPRRHVPERERVSVMA